MFIGHFGIGFGAKKAAPKVSLGTLFLAAQFLDLLWPTFLLLGWEQVEIEPGNTTMTPLHFIHYPWSHSLLMTIGWGLIFALVYYLIRRYRRGALITGLAVVSHWILDLFVHAPDLPLYPGSDFRMGWSLWDNAPVAIVIESLIFIAGVWLYVRSTRSKDRIGSIAFWLLVAFLAAIYLSNIFGPPPPDVNAIAWAGQLQWLFIIWAYWVDRHREARQNRIKPEL